MSIALAKMELTGIGGRLVDFMSLPQRRSLMEMLEGEEKEEAARVLLELADRIEKMPKTYETDGQGDNAIVYLHYFTAGSMDAYIIEKDMGGMQIQAFGFSSFLRGEGETGYINILDWIRGDAELDLYWTPKPLKDVK
jgi:hypothetical protein